jgi:hypothetical protein
LNEFPTLENLVGLVKECLGLMDVGFEVRFEGRIDIGSSNDPRMKMMSLVCNEKEWTTHIRVVMKSDICGIELVARMVGWNNVGDESSWSPMLPEVVDEQGFKCGVVLTQQSQKSQDNINADEPPPPSLAVSNSG